MELTPAMLKVLAAAIAWDDSLRDYTRCRGCESESANMAAVRCEDEFRRSLGQLPLSEAAAIKAAARRM